MRGRVGELEALRAGLAAGSPDALTRARRVGHALRGSGGTFGFLAISEAGAMLEDGPPESLSRLVEGMVSLLRKTAWPDDPSEQGAHAWLPAAVGLPPRGAATLDEAWDRTATALGVAPVELARRVASFYGVPGPESLRPTSGALRLVPDALLRERSVLPLDEDGRAIRVATSDPVDLTTEAEIRRVTGRNPVFVVVPPGELRAALAGAPDPRNSGVAAVRSRGPTPAPGRCTILVVDDDPGARMLARVVLGRKEYRVVEAANGAEALERFSAHPGISLAVVDLQMPGMGGRELVRRLRATPGAEHLPIVVLTGTEDPTTEADLIEDGADDYLQKPLDPRLFLARVSATLRRSGGGGD
ncbi:MAG: response regulator [Longimicrobiales bacterium]|nr:response regulator [Longimicrobiales bacterium]